MNTETSSQEIAPTENLLVVDHKGRVLSRRVSQVYGRALLGAMALRVPSLPSMQLHGSCLQQNEPFTLNKVRKAVRTVAPRDNLIFIEDGGKILSCQINFDYGRALLESLQHTSEDASETRAVLSRATFTGANETGNHGGNMMTHSSGHASEEMHQDDPSTSSPSLGTSTPSAKNLGILSDQILSSANRHPYDRDWMNRHCIKEDCLDGSLSKHKVDVLIRHGAIRVGDRLCVTYHPDSGPVVKAGEVLQSPKQGRLDLRIAPAREDFDGILHDCKAPEDIINGMDKEFQMERNSKPWEAWKLVRVVAGDGQEMGSLWKVRHAYQVFADRMAE